MLHQQEADQCQMTLTVRSGREQEMWQKNKVKVSEQMMELKQ